MKSLILTISTFLSAAAFAADLQTVPYVDLGRYVGDWYEISHIPQGYQKGECACARQRLTAVQDGTVGVFNSCNESTSGGALQTINGVATNTDKATNAKFNVTFDMGQTGTYWIIGLDTDYRYSVVSNESGEALYILSKTPTLDPTLYAEALLKAGQQMDVTKLKMTAQEYCTYP